jgi:hypothetical protein
MDGDQSGSQTNAPVQEGLDWRLPLLVSLAALVVAGAHAMWPDMTIDSVTLGLLAIALVPWLGRGLGIRRLAIPGGPEIEYFERRLQAQSDLLSDTRQSVSEVRTTAVSAESQAVAAMTASSVALPPGAAQTGAAPTGAALSPETELARVVDDYDGVRATQGAGDRRTRAMTDIVVGQMIPLVPSLTAFDVRRALSEKGGMRLAAYVYCYSRPSLEFLDDLIQSIGEPGPDLGHPFAAKPFEQYWGILALRKILGLSETGEIPPHVSAELRKLRQRLKPGTDRYNELTRTLESIAPR